MKNQIIAFMTCFLSTLATAQTLNIIIKDRQNFVMPNPQHERANEFTFHSTANMDKIYISPGQDTFSIDFSSNEFKTNGIVTSTFEIIYFNSSCDFSLNYTYLKENEAPTGIVQVKEVDGDLTYSVFPGYQNTEAFLRGQYSKATEIQLD